MVERPLVQAVGLTRWFDLSPPWLDRALHGRPRRRVVAVDAVDFGIPAGTTFSLVGESGCGKSTVARLVVGLLRPSNGHALFDGHDLAALSRARQRPVRRRMQMIFQDPFASLNPRWRVNDIIAEPIRAFRLIPDADAQAARVRQLLDQVGLAAADGDRRPHEFSGGQRQRISIARALASNPEFLVCDEPTSALDVSVQAQILNLMKDLQRELGLTYLFISHNLAVVAHMSDWVGVMYLGRLVEKAPAAALFAKPRHPYSRMLLDSVPDLSMSGRRRAPTAGEPPNPIDPPPGCPYHPRCPLANDRCRVERPALRPDLMADAAGRLTACHAVEEGRG